MMGKKHSCKTSLWIVFKFMYYNNFRSVESNYSMICVTNICWTLFDFMDGVQNFLQYSLSVVHHVQEGSTVSY